MTREQTAGAVLMIRPYRFYPNPETAADNAFQQSVAASQLPEISIRAQREFDGAVGTLGDSGVTVHVVDDT
ncbi:MAG TPA: arginine deiminase-related protein, partial [Chthoniobacterales bacterium]